MIQDLRLASRRLWQQLSWSQRFTVVGLTAASAAAIAALVMWANTPTYVVLFSNLSSQDAGAMVTQLEASKVPYQLANGGGTILVPQPLVYKTRIQLASQGLPQGDSVGFALFDKQNVFSSDSFTEQINYTRALEGELGKTIGQINGMVYNRVNIVLPQQQLFSSQQASPTASVLLKLAPGVTLSGDQIGGIQHLVASSVQGLKPDAVTVVDGTGTILSSNATTDGVGSTGLTALAAETRYASNLEAQLGAMLDTVLGPDRAVVRVNDTMDWTQRETTAHTYAPQSANSPLSESHVLTNTSLSPGSSVGGVPGLGSNVPTYGITARSSGVYTQTQQRSDNVYANSSTVTHVTPAPGTVQRLSVAVLVDNAYVRSPGEMAALRQALSAAAGIVPARGDRLTVTGLTFDNSTAATAAHDAATASQQEFILAIVRWAALIVVPLILLFLLRRLLVRSRAEEDDELPALEVHEQEAALLPAGAPAEPKLLEQAREARSQNLMRQSMADLAREKPEVVAGLIGRWIEEDR